MTSLRFGQEGRSAAPLGFGDAALLAAGASALKAPGPAPEAAAWFSAKQREVMASKQKSALSKVTLVDRIEATGACY